MKYKVLTILAVLTAVVLLGCKNSSGSPKWEVNFDKDASYAVGLSIGANLRNGLTADGVYPNINEFMKGMKDGITGRDPRFDLLEANQMIDAAFEALIEARNAEATQAGVSFLAENAGKPGIHITPSGLQYEIISEGDGPKPQITDNVRVHYEGKLIDGTVFDSSYQYGTPAQFPLSGVIAGWTEGLQLMNVGSKYRLFIPSELGYGAFGAGPSIPPFSALIFEVELLEILR
jgi:FKBP-type peptidyl-prolyl cis-trans isomerase FklB